jgi:hypothetical protein
MRFPSLQLIPSPTILLNHLTAPNCIIWSAIIASAAVPGILNPVSSAIQHAYQADLVGCFDGERSKWTSQAAQSRWISIQGRQSSVS